jgi:glycosyltransferase involved in cell wall biosynthesis
MGLGALRALGLFRRPIVTVMHHPPSGGRQPTLCLNGFDRILCLSRRLMADMIHRFPRLVDRVQHVEWGVDVDFHRPMPGKAEFLLCEGKTLRDYDTLSRALAIVSVPTRIYTTPDCAPSAPPACVDLHVVSPKHFREAGQEINLSYRHSLAVAIPMQDHAMLIGLTSLLTAMAHGKPVICTRNPYLDIDIEAEGCGRWVRPGNLADWIEALSSLRNRPDEWRAMGERGRLLCEQRFNSGNFGGMASQVVQACLPT